MLITNYVKSGWRNLTKNKLFSLINVSGLSIGLAITTLILFWVVDELGFDKFHTNIDNIYTVFEHQQYADGQELFTACTPFALGNELTQKYEEVKLATTFTNLGNRPLKYGDKQFVKGPIVTADSNFFNVFSFNLIQGDLKNATAADKIILTPEVATAFFGDENPIGKTLQFNNSYPLEVAAIVEEPGKKSSVNFKVIVPLEFLGKNDWTNIHGWGGNWPRTSLVLGENVNVDLLAGKIKDICRDHGQQNTSLYLFPFEKEHLYNYSGNNNRIQYIYQFLGIAFIIILIASINFVNFSTARSEQRKPEIGIRKSLGATKLNLIKLFFFEKGLTVAISILVSIVFVILLLPVFSQYTDKTITLALFKDKVLIFMLLGVIFTIMALSVLYPALYMSSFAPARVIKKQATRNSLISFKNVLIVIQFAMSVGLIICSIFISKQLKYVNGFDLGYDKDNLVYLEMVGSSGEKHKVFVNEFKQLSGVTDITRCGNLPMWGGSSSWGFSWDGKDSDKEILFSHTEVDRNYLKTLGIKLNHGSTFSEHTDNIAKGEQADEIILNQEAIKAMGMENPIGKKFWGSDGRKARIMGVAKNYNFQSLRNKIEPIILLPLSGDPGYMIMRIDPKKFSNTVDEIKRVWDEVCPDTKYSLGFFDDRFEDLYNSEQRIAGLFKLFTLIAIFISCIGLFGLSLYAIEVRRKEIGIRKVNGSTRLEIISLINREFVIRVIVALIVASPLSYFIMSQWLQNFAYKTELSWWVFLASGSIALVVALLTVSFQSWKAATRNPVESLRYE